MKALLGVGFALCGTGLYAQASSPGAHPVNAQSHGVVVTQITAVTDDSVWRIEYAVNNPSARYGSINTIKLDVALPRGVGSNALSGKDVTILADGMTTPAATKSHVPMQVEAPTGWYVTAYSNGIFAWQGDTDTKDAYYVISPETGLGGFTITETGIPMLRLAWTEPFTPVAVIDDKTGATHPGAYPKGLHAGVSDASVSWGQVSLVPPLRQA